MLAWCVLSLFLVIVVLLTTTQLRDAKALAFDGGRYVAMVERDRAAPVTEELVLRARSAGSLSLLNDAERLALLTHLPPFCWRVLTPFLASLLPFPPLVGMKVLAFLAGWLTLSLLGALLRRCGLSTRATVCGLLLYGGSFWALKSGFFRPSYIDFMTQPFIVGSLLALSCGRYWMLPPIIALGVLQKESLLYLVPIALLQRGSSRGWKDRSFAVYAAVLVVLPVGARLSVIWLIDPVAPYAHLSTLATYLRHFERQVFDPAFWPRLAMAAMSALGVMLPAVLVRPRSCGRELRRQPHMLLLLLLGLAMLWGGADKSRIFLYVLPVVALLVARLMEPALHRPSPVAWVWLSATFLAHFAIGHLQLELFPSAFKPAFAPVHAPLEAVLPHLAGTLLLLLGWTLLTLLCERLGCRPLLHGRPVAGDGQPSRAT